MAVNKRNTGGISRARRIANASKTPIEQAQTFVGREVPTSPVQGTGKTSTRVTYKVSRR